MWCGLICVQLATPIELYWSISVHKSSVTHSRLFGDVGTKEREGIDLQSP